MCYGNTKIVYVLRNKSVNKFGFEPTTSCLSWRYSDVSPCRSRHPLRAGDKGWGRELVGRVEAGFARIVKEEETHKYAKTGADHKQNSQKSRMAYGTLPHNSMRNTAVRTTRLLDFSPVINI